MYSVKIKATGRYVKWCDDCWYETTAAPLQIYTKEEAEKIARLMRKHYVYSVIISDGTTEYEVSAFKPKMAEKQAVSTTGKLGVKKIKFNF